MTESITSILSIKEVILDGHELTLPEFIAVARYHARLKCTSHWEQKITDSRELVQTFLKENRIIYGVTTGFGENVKYTIAPEDAATLQRNILRSHAVSVGEPLNEECVRAVILMILLNIGHGISGVQLATVKFLIQLLNQNLYPYAPSEGSVGYLAVEAHICLTLLGEGFFLVDHKKIPACELLREKGLAPVSLGCKEGLALITGTTSATALGLLALYDSLVAEKNMEIINAVVYESLKATTKALEPVIHQQKKHSEQSEIADRLYQMLSDSPISQAFRNSKVQDACLLRALCQVMGANLRLIKETKTVLLDEMHSCSDNPILISEDAGSSGTAWMTGNFDGTYVAEHCDILCMANASLGTIAERCTDRMINHHINDGLPSFLIHHPGLNSGLMIPQYTQAGLLGQLKLYAVPASTDSITTCAGQEDPVSMAYNSAKKALQSSRLLIHMTAIELLTAVQAVDLTMEQTGLKESSVLSAVHDEVRKSVDFLENDRYLSADIASCENMIRSLDLIKLAESKLSLVI